MAVKGKCRCGKLATSDWLISHEGTKRNPGSAWTSKYCTSCAPRYEQIGLQQIHGPRIKQYIRKSPTIPRHNHTNQI